MDSQNIIVLGGGIGGLVAANELRQLLPTKHRITIIERNEEHAFAPSFLWVMNGTPTLNRSSDQLDLFFGQA